MRAAVTLAHESSHEHWRVEHGKTTSRRVAGVMARMLADGQ